VVAVCFCGAAKTTSLGIPLITAMWSQLDNRTISSIQVPVLLYTMEQVFVAQFFTIFMKHWLQKGAKGDEEDVESLAADTRPSATEQASEVADDDVAGKQDEVQPGSVQRSKAVQEKKIAGD
jgi:solute carrier family 10 (sodium/bile acid cotransporter), member 7